MDYMNASDFEDAADCVSFWRRCLENLTTEDTSYDALRWISYEQECACEMIGFASA